MNEVMWREVMGSHTPAGCSLQGALNPRCADFPLRALVGACVALPRWGRRRGDRLPLTPLCYQ